MPVKKKNFFKDHDKNPGKTYISHFTAMNVFKISIYIIQMFKIEVFHHIRKSLEANVLSSKTYRKEIFIRFFFHY